MSLSASLDLLKGCNTSICWGHCSVMMLWSSFFFYYFFYYFILFYFLKFKFTTHYGANRRVNFFWGSWEAELNLGSAKHGQVTLKKTKVQRLSSFWIRSCWPGFFSWISFKPHKFSRGLGTRESACFPAALVRVVFPWCVMRDQLSPGTSALLLSALRWQIGSSMAHREVETLRPEVWEVWWVSF